VDVATPVVGSGSLRLVGSADGPGAIQGRWGLAANRGFRQGRVTTLVQPVAGVAGTDLYGVYGAASVSDLTGTSGTAYAALLVCGPPWAVEIVKVMAGFGSALTVLQSTAIPMDFGETFGLQLQWISNPEIGTALRLAVGRALDFTDLVAGDIVQEPSIVILASQGEGVMAYLTASGDVKFDQSHLEEL
jgi:hypothetical protein